ncbi:DPP IV N-terminal domain-containing protein [uncultured Arcticibacterium sp.]|uniref:DPP IV N-terminal domain-containing protein n=1 Tax=uncultured Arcticibacterium sp. TaxID=2173042 RepID=UPI0030F71945
MYKNHKFVEQKSCSTNYSIKLKLYSAFLLVLITSSLTKASILGDTTIVSINEGTNMAAELSPDKKTITIDLQGTIWTLPATGGKAIKVTDGMGDDRQPTWSPDGSKIAFQSFRDGYYHIWMINKDGTGLKQVTSGAFDEREPDWSPDGKFIVYSSDVYKNYDLFKINIESSEVTQLTSNEANEYCPAYSPDGKEIAYVSEQKDAPGIYKLNEAGKSILISTRKGALSAPSWNFKGDFMYFTEFTGSYSGLGEIDLKSGETTIITTTEIDVFPFRTSWLDSKEYIYTSNGKIKKATKGMKSTSNIEFEAELMVVTPTYTRKPYDFDSGTPEKVKGIKGLSVSPDGKKYLFTAFSDIYILEDGKSKPEPLFESPFICSDPVWSPDGKQIAYLTDKSGNMNLWIFDIATATSTQILKLDEDINYPSWSPDGQKIAFYLADARNIWGKGTLQAIDLKSKKVEKLHEALFVPSQPSWSPDGKTIALSALDVYSTRFREGINKILLISLEDKSEKFISPVEERSLGMRAKNGPLWSPNGKWIAYVLDGLLWVINVDKKGNIIGPPVRLTNELSEVPSWTSDSKSIVYLATDNIKKVSLEDMLIEEIPMDFNWDYSQPAGKTVIHAGKVFDGISEKYLTDVDIIINENRIEAILQHEDGRTGKLIDASDKTVIPGLFEMHTHQHAMTGEKLGRLWLSYGITSLRETGSDPYDAIERKESWNTGKLTGPREFFTGGLTDGTRIYYGLANSIQSSAQLDLELDRAVELGYDLIKTYVRMPDILQRKITAFAHKNGIPVSSHEIFPAMRYAVDAVEHIGGTSRRGYSPKITKMNHTYDDVIQLLVKSQMNITPTASLQGGFYAMAAKYPWYYKNKQLINFFGQSYVDNMEARASQIANIFPGYLSNFSNIQVTLKKLINEGASVTAGTDSPFIPYGYSLHAELHSWVDSGISPYVTLKAATIGAATAVGVSKDLGSIEKGKLADLVIVNGDPLSEITDALNVEYVIKNGITYTFDELMTSPK